MKKIAAILIVLALFGGMISAEGQQDKGSSFPNKDITLIVPWSAGGGTDTIARALVKNAPEHIGVNVNVVNKTGGQGVVGMGAAMAARPDGYTVGMITFGLSTYNLMGLSDMTYRDFELLQLLNQSAAVLYVNADSQWDSLKDLVEYAKANPGQVSLGHTGAGGDKHLSAASLATELGIEFNYVPFDGAAPARSAVLGGHVDVAVAGIAEIKQLYEAGEVKVLSVNNVVEEAGFPDIPTVVEAGYDISAPVLDWRGLALPKGVDPEVVAILEEGFKKMFDDPEFRAFCDEVGLNLVYKNSAGYEEFLSNMEKVLEPTLESVGLLK
ncbi:MAG: tripartite tricarboxylate transporter substrate binding protein [Spirochaetales bacterium]|nr:tripartite tricarboxylate transporter substrate binding protein [Spirochaetales bacterium]